MKKVMTIIGARPQFIKAAVVSKSITEYDGLSEILVHTGQHYDVNMSDIFFDDLKIPKPNYHLGIGGGTHAQNTGRMLEKLESLMMLERPDWVLVYGDTDSTLSGALAASKLNIPVAHVEAGLRSFNRKMPEELNRLLTDHISSALFTPTQTASDQLIKEGIPLGRIEVVGDVMYDAALIYGEKARPPANFLDKSSVVKPFALCTVHRAENTDDLERMKGILTGLASSQWTIVLPVHPRTKMRLDQYGLTFPPNVRVINPVSFLEMIWLIRNCCLVVTDSGGLQKEAFFHGKPCVTMRDETEWNELVDIGVNYLAGTDSKRIAKAMQSNFSKNSFKNKDIYGVGQSGSLIAKYLMEN